VTRKRHGCTRASAADIFDLQKVSDGVQGVFPSLGEWSGIDLIFIDAGVKINDAYYREVLLTEKLMPVMCKICAWFFILQQGNVPPYRTRETIDLLKRDTCVHFTTPFATQQHISEPG